ncbi:MAG: hypothetical protein AMXMBFR64_30040 [Myxococcales bacterium]
MKRRTTALLLSAILWMGGCAASEPVGEGADAADGGPPDGGSDAGGDDSGDVRAPDGASELDGTTAGDALEDTTQDDGQGDDTTDATDATDATDTTDTTGTADATDTTDATTDASPPGDTGAGEDPWKEAFDHVFPQDHVVALKLDFPDGGWLKLLTTWQQSQLKVEYPAAFGFDDESLDVIGVRLKGLNSLNVPAEGPIPLGGKYPLKMDFNTFGGPRFHEVDEVNLSINVSDPSLMRERLAERMYEAMGVPASRSAYAGVTIDGSYVGLYTMVQVIDKRYLKERFGTAGHADDGNLYKCLHNSQDICSLQWRGPSKEDYIQTEGCAAGYAICGLLLKTNEDDPALNDYGDVIALMDVLAHTPDEAFPAAIEAIFDVDSFLRLTAVAMIIGNWDSYFGKGHNYYLYHRPDTGKLMMLPWDLDLTYEGPLCSQDPTKPDCWGPGARPLVQRILAVPAYQAQYVAYLKEAVDEHFTVEAHAAWIGELDGLIGTLVGGDPNIQDKGAYGAAIAPDGAGGSNLIEFIELRRKELSSWL